MISTSTSSYQNGWQTPIIIPTVGNQPVRASILLSPAQDFNGVTSELFPCFVMVDSWWEGTESILGRLHANEFTVDFDSSTYHSYRGESPSKQKRRLPLVHSSWYPFGFVADSWRGSKRSFHNEDPCCRGPCTPSHISWHTLGSHLHRCNLVLSQ